MQRVPAARLRLCLRCAVSWTGVARASSVKEKDLVWKKYRAKVVFKIKYNLEDE